jgi:NAD(P)-dependent dehydrogenase (short-subunit alcohol dehydrogenase family)
MARVLITGSTTGLGEGAARQLLGEGHEVVLHARSPERARDVDALALAGQAVGVVVGDLADAAETRAVADQANAIGGIDVVIHNAAIYADGERAHTLAVNVVAPYVLTALIEGPRRLIYLSSDMHRSGNPSPHAFDWSGSARIGTQAYCDSKLYLTALAMALARRWPDMLVSAVDPGWVPTRMGGRGAPDDLVLGHRTQAWLAVSHDVDATTTGRYWHHQSCVPPAAAALDEDFQSAVIRELQAVTGTALPSPGDD